MHFFYASMFSIGTKVISLLHHTMQQETTTTSRSEIMIQEIKRIDDEIESHERQIEELKIAKCAFQGRITETTIRKRPLSPNSDHTRPALCEWRTGWGSGFGDCDTDGVVSQPPPKLPRLPPRRPEMINGVPVKDLPCISSEMTRLDADLFDQIKDCHLNVNLGKFGDITEDSWRRMSICKQHWTWANAIGNLLYMRKVPRYQMIDRLRAIIPKDLYTIFQSGSTIKIWKFDVEKTIERTPIPRKQRSFFR